MFSSKLKHDILTLGSGSKLGQNSESGSKFNVFTRRSTFTTLPNFEYYHLSQIPGWIWPRSACWTTLTMSAWWTTRKEIANSPHTNIILKPVRRIRIRSQHFANSYPHPNLTCKNILFFNNLNINKHKSSSTIFLRFSVTFWWPLSAKPSVGSGFNSDPAK